MSHELNELAPGVHSYVGARTDAWHKLGTTLVDTFDAATALREGHLANWNVRKLDLAVRDDLTDGLIEVPNRWGTVYTNPLTGKTQYLGTVGSHYEPIQNETHVDLLNSIVDESGANFETAGSLKGGRETFVTMKLPNTIQVGGADPIDLYLVALNSHDGQSKFKFLITPIRVVCWNTQMAALGAAKSSFSIRHVKGATGHIQEAREALDLTFKYMDAFEQEAEKMIAKSLRDAAFEKVAMRLFNADVATTERQKNKTLEHVAGVRDLWKNSPTLDGIRGTRWGGYQAITEYTDHFMAVRNTGKSADVARAVRTVTSADMKLLKEAAFHTFRSTVLA